MISVLIPVYNTDISALVEELHRQRIEANLLCEIIAFDDGSIEFKSLNRQACLKNSIIYKELDKNCGRTQIRQKLANTAKFDWLLFIDSDSKLVNNNYLKNYFDNLDFYDSVVGGTVYSDKKPVCSRRLHWYYGKEREVFSTQKMSFRTNNFCIRKKLFLEIEIPRSIEGYGHEDTFIGIVLDKTNVRIDYIDNPVLHLGLEDTFTFIEKTKNALRNLKELERLIDKETLKRHVTIYKVYCQSSTFHGPITWLFRIIKPFLLKNLTSCRPNLYFFDFYRLALFINLTRN